jgi:hypothetical protein
MLNAFSLVAMCFMMTLILQVADFSNPQDAPQARASRGRVRQ